MTFNGSPHPETFNYSFVPTLYVLQYIILFYSQYECNSETVYEFFSHSDIDSTYEYGCFVFTVYLNVFWVASLELFKNRDDVDRIEKHT